MYVCIGFVPPEINMVMMGFVCLFVCRDGVVSAEMSSRVSSTSSV